MSPTFDVGDAGEGFIGKGVTVSLQFHDVREDGTYPPLREVAEFEARTLVEALLRAAGLRHGITFRGTSDRFYSYAELYGGALRNAETLQARGGTSGRRVGLILGNSPAFVQWFFGALIAGMTPVPLASPSSFSRRQDALTRLSRQLETAKVRVIVTRGALLSRIRPSADLVGAEVIDAGMSQEVQPESKGPPSLGSFHGSALFSEVHPDDVALVQFSSGTTSSPRAVRLSHRQILSNVRSIWRSLIDPAGDSCVRGVSWLPFHHDMGLIGFLLGAVASASDLLVMEPESFAKNPASWLEAIADFGATVSAAPNFAYRACADLPSYRGLEPTSLVCWKVALTGAEHICADTLRQFSSRFSASGFCPRAFTPVYGLSEATLFVTGAEVDRPFRSLWLSKRALARGVVEQVAEGSESSREVVSVGRCPRGTSSEIRDSRGAPCAEGQVGSLWVRGPSVMSGYDGGGEPRLDGAGWLDTCDLAFRWQGELYVVGRRSDVIIIRGRNYTPEPIEQAIESLDGVRKGRAIVASVHRLEKGTEELVVAVETGRLNESAERTLRRRIRRAVANEVGSVPAEVLFVRRGQFPLTPNGKKRRHAVARMLESTLGIASNRATWTEPQLSISMAGGT